MHPNLSLRPNLIGPLYRQVYETLRVAIIEGTLKAQQRLAASRELASQLGVSRNTVNTAYDMLQAEGYIESRPGSGFYVTEIEAKLIRLPQQQSQYPAITVEASLSQRGQQLAKASRPVPDISNSAFQPGLPDLNHFPYKAWRRCLQKAAGSMNPSLMQYQDQGGLPELKLALKDYLCMSRGLKCDVQQIIIVNGSQAGLDLISRMCINPGEHIAIENPGYLGAKDGFSAAGAKLIPVNIDDQGIQINLLQQLSRDIRIRLAYVTPSYQFPSGMIMSASRRMELLQWAAKENAFIIEDDYDSELRYSGQPLSSLQGLDERGRVIYLGTFSKVMFPGLRLGYLVLPQQLASAFTLALRKTGQDSPLLLQAAMAEFILAGHFSSHLRKMRKLYGQKQQLFVELTKKHLSDLLEVEATEAGMQLACYYKQGIDEAKLLQLASQKDVVLAPLSRYYHLSDSSPDSEDPNAQKAGLFLGYAGVALEEMETNILRLKDIINKCRSPL